MHTAMSDLSMGKDQEIGRHFVVSTISGIAVFKDECILAVGTYGGMLWG
ncbi:hypothetical protein JNUCC42_15790 [Brevibacterium sp. JNUCC-42]|nr:hypothetical protein JNUCC42_15790 [Brevibacterium sp. JNUCC-42]